MSTIATPARGRTATRKAAPMKRATQPAPKRVTKP